MTLTIFHDGTMTDINDVTQVLTHSSGSVEEGLDLEVETQECNGFLILTGTIHLDKWDFYTVKP